MHTQSTLTASLANVTKPIHRKGASEERIFSDNERARTTARLMAELRRSAADRRLQHDLDVIAGRR